MKKFIRFIAVLMSFLMLVQTIPVSSASIESITAAIDPETTLNDSPTAEENVGLIEEPAAEEPYILTEDITRREENVKHFKMSDGTYQAAVYASPVHFLENGEWKEIDNTIKINRSEERNNQKYVADISDVEFSFPDKINSGDKIRVKKNGHEVSFGYMENSISVFSLSEIIDASETLSAKISNTKLETDNKYAVKNGALKYSNVSVATDIEYELNSTMLKESIIVSSKQSEYVYKFNMDIGGLTPFVNEDGSISLIDKNNEDSLEFVIAAPYMTDAKGIFSDSVEMSLTASGNEYILTVSADKEWLNSSEREFPVIIDPTLLYKPDRVNDIFDTYVDSGSPSTNHYLSTYSIIGYNSLGKGRAYLKFNLPTLPHCGVITNAQLSLIQMGYDPGNGVTNHIVVYESPAALNYQTLTWNNQPSLSSQPIVDYTAFKSGTSGSVYYIFDITKIAKNWFETGTNNGLFLASANENSSWRSTIYTSNYTGYEAYPMIQISYMDNKGLEDYWSYETIDMGRSGTVYINEYNGLMTYVHQDISLGGNITYLSVAHVYSNAHENAAPYGYGFRLTAQESITKLSENSDLYNSALAYRAYLTDADGTAHYFRKKEENKWYYEFDDKLILTASTTGYVLQYEDGSIKTYDASGKLLSIIDRNGNKITHAYDSLGRIYQITDEIGRTVTFNYTGDYLASMTDAAGRNTTYTYSNGYLQTITYPDGKTTQLTYLSGKLFNIKQADSTHVTFMYQSANRVNYIVSKGTDSAVLKNINLYYKGSNTVITDSMGRKLTVGFDNMGRAVSYTDKDGNVSTTKYNSGGNKNNKIAENSDVFSFTDNKLMNHSFENDFTSWTIWKPVGSSWYNIDTVQKYIGLKSMKLTLSTEGRTVVLQDVYNITQGKEYTFSAYVKVSAINNGNVFIRIEGKGSSSATYIESTKITAITNEWVRLQTTYTVPSTVTHLRLCVEVAGASGIAYFDSLQLEEASSAGHYNFLINPGFESYSSNTFSGWTATGTVSAVSGIVNASVGVGIAGSPSTNARLMQSISLGTSSNARTLIFGGAVKGNCAATSNTQNSNAKFGLLLELYEGSTLVTSKTVEYNAYAVDTEQLLFESLTASSSVDSARIYLLYDKNVNTSYFDNIFVYVDNFGTKYTYNNDGKLIAQSNNAGDTISYTYNGPDIKKISVTKNGVEKDSCEYTYDSNHNILTETTKDGIITTYTYSSLNSGMPTNITVTDSAKTVKSSVSYTYMLFDNYTRKITDARGKTESYFYNSNKDLVTSYTDANGAVTNYEYNSNNDELTRVYTTVGSETVDVNYSTDTNGRLSAITQDGVSYGFTYDVFGRRTATKVGSQTLASYAYNSKGLLGSTTYGNGTVHSLTYDESDRIISEAYNGTTAATYSYNTEGYLGKTIDHELGITTYYGYDLVGRVTDVDSSDGVSSDFLYNEYNSIAGYTVKKNNALISSGGYSYNENGLLTSVATNSSTYNSFSYTYDALNRLYLTTHPVSGSAINTIYLYTAGTNSETTGLISMMGYMNGNSQFMPSLSYTYDNNGNILTIAKNGTTHISYTYDSLNRLIREDNKDLNQSVTYSYDNRGNILSKKYYDYTTGILGTLNDEITYTYDSVWKDKLINYGGESFSYDSIGNPTIYRGVDAVWQKGRQLKSFGLGGITILSYEYNIDGLRTEKYYYFTDTTTTYTWSSGLLMQQSDGTNTLKFSYSPDGRPLGVIFNGTSYYYIYNLQGDVIGIYDHVGAVVVKYTYDSWGKLIDTTGTLENTLGQLNPFRYRGYIYDEEIGLYWLRSRYYDPQIGRFLNADGYVSTDTGLNGYNMFAYCNNNSVCYHDSQGTRRFESTSLANETKEERKQSFNEMNESVQINITKKLDFVMKENSAELRKITDEQSYLNAAVYFVNKVKPNGDWDFKSQSSWGLSPRVTYIYNGQKLRFDDIGNIHYGYVGRVLFSEDILLVAGGIVQIYTKSTKWEYWSTNFDDPRDQWAISYGCSLWDLEV